MTANVDINILDILYVSSLKIHLRFTVIFV